jgi:DNA-binding IclR family transcriptional regulator
MALNYLNLLLSPKYMETEGVHMTGHLSDKRRIIEALRQKSPLTLDELARITHLRKISVQYLVTKLRQGGKLGYAQRSTRTCPKFCLPTDPLFLGYSEDRKSFSYEAILGAFEEGESLTVNRLAYLTGFSSQMCRRTLRELVCAGEIVICGKAGEHRFSGNVYAINQETRNRA